MEKITCILAVNTRGQRFYVITTTVSTRCLVEIFQLICYWQRVNATLQYNDSSSSFSFLKWSNNLDGYKGEKLLAPCSRKKRLQRKMTKDHYWIGAEENIGIFRKS